MSITVYTFAMYNNYLFRKGIMILCMVVMSLPLVYNAVGIRYMNKLETVMYENTYKVPAVDGKILFQYLTR